MIRPPRHGWRRAQSICAALLVTLALLGGPAHSANNHPVIALIIDDLGDSLSEGRRVARLPGPVACAILPHTAHGRRIAEEARAHHKEVMLHLPMQPSTDAEPGPGQLDDAMPALEVKYTLDDDLASLPGVVGINNHMGSHLTQDRDAMHKLMQAIRARGNLFFIDSRTSPRSVAAAVARELAIPSATRDVFLDNDRQPAAIEAQFDELIRIAQQQGAAIGIGHPYPETLAVLERRLKTLAAQRVQLVPVSAMLKRSTEHVAWPTSLSPSPTVPKSSKP
jgi:hypothetical protein